MNKAPGLDQRWGGTWSDRGCHIYFAGSLWDAGRTFLWDFMAWYIWNIRLIPFISDFFTGFSIPSPLLSINLYDSWYHALRGSEAYRDPDRTTRTGYTDWIYGSRLLPQEVVEDRTNEIVDFLVSVSTPDEPIEGYYLGGVMQDVGPEETAVHPAMRKAVFG